MRFNIEDYKGKYVMHCKTEEEAEIFCEYLHSIGRTWGNGDSYKDDNNDRIYAMYGAETCFEFNIGRYGSKQYFEEEGYTILEMKDFMDKEENELNHSNKNGIDHTEDVFKLLGLSPDEVFKVKSFSNGDYKITQDLMVYVNVKKGCWAKSAYTIADFLNGTLKIYKKPVPTEIEQLAINYALACGYHWLAKDSDGDIYAYAEVPYKTFAGWAYKGNYAKGKILKIELPISFLSWEDEEPYYIGD